MKKATIILFLIFLLAIVSCKNDDDNCQYMFIPISNSKYVVSGAGLNDSNGEYFNNYFVINGKPSYVNPIKIVVYIIEYDTTYGWCIVQGGMSNSIFYYTNIHTDNPPGDSSTIWQIKDGTPPAPIVKSEVYYYQQLICM